MLLRLIEVINKTSPCSAQNEGIACKHVGGKNRHVYYHCSHQVDNTCKESYVKEKGIVDGLVMICNQLITDLAGLEPGLRAAIEKFTLMMKAIHKGYGKKNLIAGYVKYVLQEGAEFEKTRLVRNLNINLAIHNRTIVKVN